MVTSYHRGHKTIITKSNEIIYADNKILIKDDFYRYCLKCKEKPNEEGHDVCIANLPGVFSACCGHGIEEGYIVFDNGIRIRGKFKIENINCRR